MTLDPHEPTLKQDASGQPVQAEQSADDRYADLYEDQVMNALLGGSPILIQTEIGFGKKKMDLSMHMRWPSVGEQQEIGRLTTLFLGGFESRYAVPRDLMLARARATIEVLGVAPFPAWLPPHKEPSEDANGQRRFRPNTAAVRVDAALHAIFNEFEEVHDRFLTVGLD